MAQKFGNSRWVKEGFLDNRASGRVAGRITFAAIGPVEFLLRGDFTGEIKGRLITFRNPAFVDDDVAAQVLGDFEIPQVGEVSLISFDPHPLLAPHPYIEWFSDRQNHYRIELAAGAASIAGVEEERALEHELSGIVERLSALPAAPTRARDDSDWV
ncbi:MAG: hypothetical protein ACREIL_04700 [Nitrospiraceae bacterium]